MGTRATSAGKDGVVRADRRVGRLLLVPGRRAVGSCRECDDSGRPCVRDRALEGGRAATLSHAATHEIQRQRGTSDSDVLEGDQSKQVHGYSIDRGAAILSTIGRACQNCRRVRVMSRMGGLSLRADLMVRPSGSPQRGPSLGRHGQACMNSSVAICATPHRFERVTASGARRNPTTRMHRFGCLERKKLRGLRQSPLKRIRELQEQLMTGGREASLGYVSGSSPSPKNIRLPVDLVREERRAGQLRLA